MPTYLKMLRADGTSLNRRHRYVLPIDEQPGDWQEVPGNGCYLAEWRDSELFAGGAGDVLWEVEADREVCKSGIRGVHCCSPIRLVRTIDWSELVDGWHAALALRYCEELSEGQVEALVRTIDQSKYAYLTLRYCERLNKAQQGQLRKVREKRWIASGAAKDEAVG